MHQVGRVAAAANAQHRSLVALDVPGCLHAGLDVVPVGCHAVGLPLQRIAHLTVGRRFVQESRGIVAQADVGGDVLGQVPVGHGVKAQVQSLYVHARRILALAQVGAVGRETRVFGWPPAFQTI